MIQFKIYNDDKVRRWSNFPSMKDPLVLENTLLQILNELFLSWGQPIEKEFNILNPRFSNLYAIYYTSSNFQSWGTLPLGYVYNDMIRHIQNRNTSSNFTMTLESITFSSDEIIPLDIGFEYQNSVTGMAYEIVSSYITENYLNSYNYIINNNNGVMVIMVPTIDKVTCYIISVGFDPISMSKWFCTDTTLNNENSLPYTRYSSLKGIVSVKLGKSERVTIEMSDSRIREAINPCIRLVKSYDISLLKKKSIYDTEIKYGNFPIDYNWLSIYDNAVPAAYYAFIDKKSDKYLLTKFNQPDEYRVDYRILKRQNDLIKITEKRKEIGVGD